MLLGCVGQLVGFDLPVPLLQFLHLALFLGAQAAALLGFTGGSMRGAFGGAGVVVSALGGWGEGG
jgi:hypothetical protein